MKNEQLHSYFDDVDDIQKHKQTILSLKTISDNPKESFCLRDLAKYAHFRKIFNDIGFNWVVDGGVYNKPNKQKETKRRFLKK